MVLSLIGPLDNARVQRILLIAAYAGTTLKVVPITVGVENETESYRRNCHPLARVPVLKSDEGYLFETHAIARYIARTERPYGADGCDRYPSPQHQVPYLLYGKSVKEAAEVDAWLDFVMMEIDTHAFPILHAEKQQQEQQKRPRVASSRNNNNNNTTTTMPLVSAAELKRLQEALEEGLHGLEQRLVFMKELRRLMGTTAGGSSHTYGNRQSNNNNNDNNNNHHTRALSSARTGTLDEVEDGLSEEDMYISATPRESAVLRGYHTYNIKTRMEVPPDANPNNDDNNNNINNHNNNHTENMGDGNMVLPRLSTQSTRLSTQTPRRSANPNMGDLLFLVGDSLTAADLVVAAAVNNALQAKCVQPNARQQYPQLVRYVSSIMRLPVAADVRKALGMSLI